MLEPTNNKTAETNNSTPTKPVEIQHDLFDLKPNEISSYSAYASAESSPTQGNSLIPKQELKQQINKSESSSSSSSSLNSYLTIENSSKLLMMDDLLLPGGRETPTNNSTKTLTTTETFLDDYDQEAGASSSNRNYLEDEFQSLPCHYPDDLILQPTKFINNSIQQQETVNSLINKEIEEQLIDFKANQLQQQPSTSPSANSKSSIKSAIGCFFEKVLFGSNEKTPAVVVEPPKPSSDNLMNKSKSSINFTETSNKLLTSNESVTHTKLPTSTTTNGIASASSPNPDCSPYKLLLNEIPSTSNIVINDFNSRNLISSSTNNTNTNTKNNLNENEKELNKNSDKPNNLIENLASLNQKESDKIDPILSQLVNAKTASVSSIDKVEKQQQQQQQAKKTTNDSDDVLKQPVSLLVNETSTKVDHVPASSHEFCMDLNFNLAAAAAATAAGPVVVSALPPPLITTTTTNSSVDHNRFTSNASTSSIHNDLKMILEESKDQQQEQKHKGIIDSPTQQKSKINKLQPKPQRVHNTSGGRTKSASSTSETNNKKSTEFISSDSNNLNLIKTLMSMVENNKKNNSKQQQDKPVINWPKKENGRYRYTKEFLNQINEQRAEFIDQIYPEIFRVYSTCMNGKYWDPEQYFDIIQFPDDFDKSKNSNNRSMNNSRSYNSSVSFSNNNNNNNQKQQQSNRKRNISTTSNGNKYDNTKSKYQSNTISHSPQPLQVPKNSPKVSNHDQQNNLNLSATSSKNGKENKRKFNSILSTLGLEQTVKSNNADKILLDLIKNKASSNDKNNNNNNNNLLDMLNTKKEQFENKTRSSNILDTLLMNSQKQQQQQHQSEVRSVTNSSSSSKHFPVVLTAQELEMSQMLTQQKNSRHKLPINQNEISNFIEFESTNNTSDAYKQLVKNLSNHPLNAPTTATGVPTTTINNNQPKTNNNNNNNNNKQNQQPNWPVSNNGTNVLKQLLNLKIEQPIQKTTEKKSKSKKGHHHHHHNHNNSKTKSPSTSMLASESINKFPAVNPHEKPFENYLNEDSSSKQVEIVVASTLSHVLNNNKSPTNVLENLFEKMNTKKKSVKSENDHFYSLLNKMMPVVDTNNRQKSKQQQQQINESSSSDILKWFTGNTPQQTTTNTTTFTTTSTTTTKFSPTVLSEIEFMEMQRPQVLNKLY